MFAHRARCFLAATSLVTSGALAACEGDADDGGTADPAAVTFATTSAAEREAAIISASGAGGAFAFLALLGAGLDASKGCPVQTTEGKKVIFTAPAGGCTGVGTGTTYHGRAEVTNAALDFGGDGNIDPAAPMELAFFDFRADSPGQALAIDGTLWQSAAEPSGPYTTRYDQTIGLGDIGVSVVMELSCTGGGETATRCTANAGARGEIIGRGSFKIVMDQTTTNAAQSGFIELRGADTLRVDLVPRDAQGCMPYRIDGAVAGQLCRDEGDEPPPPPPSLPDSLVGFGVSCGSDVDGLAFAAETDGTIVDVQVTVKSGEYSVTVPLRHVGPDLGDENGIHAWGLVLVDANLPCATAADGRGYLFVATNGFGDTNCGLSGDAAQFPAGTCP